ncbi:TolC family protein [Candidatus Latescibacterota bacterium]
MLSLHQFLHTHLPTRCRWHAGLRIAALALLCPVPAAPEPAVEPYTLDLSRCLTVAMERNRELSQARERIEQVEGNRDIVRARMMPHVSLTARYDALRTEVGGQTDDTVASSLRFSQRLFEFGPDAAQEIQLRQDLREAVFGYQGKVHEVLSRVWEVYHLILLQDRQIAVREASRASFEEDLERKAERFERRLASEEDKLRAELSVLQEELEINSLRRQQFNNKMELLRLIGQPISSDIRVTGELLPFTTGQDEAVASALAADVQLALREDALAEQRRVVRELGWEYSPDLAVEAGVADGRRSASVNVDRDGRTWGVDMASEFELQENESALSPADRDARWFTSLEASIPILEGGARIGRETMERARLRQLSIEVLDLRSELELEVRQAYQSVLEAEEEQRLQEQNVQIARRRLEINESLKEKGLADEAKLEQVRDQFFSAQTALFRNQSTYIGRQAQLRRLMGYVQ